MSDDSNEDFKVKKELNKKAQGNNRITKHTTNPHLTAYRVYPLEEGKAYRLYLTYDYWVERKYQHFVKVVSSNILKLDFIHKVIIAV